MAKRTVRKSGAGSKKDQKAALDKSTITIDGRKFVPVGDTRTFEQDIHMMNLIEEMGLGNIDPNSFVGPGNVQKEAMKIITRAYRSGSLFEMLGTAMVEEGKEDEWTPEVAKEIGNLFRYTTDKTARDALERNTVFLLMEFFGSALASSTNFPSFSVELPDGAGLPRESRGEFSDSGSGSPLSGRSQKAIQIAQERLSSGR